MRELEQAAERQRLGSTARWRCSTAPTPSPAPWKRRFRRAGVPYRLVGAISFYDRREVKDLLAYLRLVATRRTTRRFSAPSAFPGGDWARRSLRRWAGRRAQWRKPLLEAAGIADRVPDLRPNVEKRSAGSPD